MKRGQVVRPVVSLAGLDARKQYLVVHVERPDIWTAIAYLADEAGELLQVENAHLVVQPVTPPVLAAPIRAWRH